VRAPAGVRRVQSMYGTVLPTRQGQVIRVTNQPVLAYQ
jgi:hypothetical protein